jgi:ABC transport system ATP-binding/permease protein
MDRLVDHLFAFEGNGEIKDFPGNYTQYRVWKQLEENAEGKMQKAEGEKRKEEGVTLKAESSEKQKLSFKEKTEFEKLEKEIAELEKEKNLLEVKLNNGSMDFEKLQETSERISVLLDKKEMRWLELSERADL